MHMKIVPTNKQGWLGLASLPFKAYMLGVALIYPYWSLHMPGRPGRIGGGDTSDGMSDLSIGFFVCFIALTVMAIVQALAKNKRDAKWNIVFAVLALVCGLALIPPYLR
jgi:hypothetical protein